MRSFVVAEIWRIKTLGRTQNFRKAATDYGVSISINGNVIYYTLLQSFLLSSERTHYYLCTICNSCV